MTTRTISRRRLIAGAGVLAAAWTAFSATSAHGETDGNVVSGVLARLQPGEWLEVLTLSGTRKVQIDGATTYNRDGVVSASAFVMGDHIVAELGPDRKADHITTLYRALSGRVLEVRDGRLSTSSGTVSLVSRTRYAGETRDMPRTREALEPGVDVEITARWEPRLREWIAREVGMPER